MIVFDLKCIDSGDVFEAWFRSGADYEDQSARGLVQCPVCRSSRIEKAPMAPRLPHRGDSGEPKAALSALAELQARLLSSSEWVGEDLPNQARAMHLGEIEPRPVHGQASVEDAQSLVEEGVPVLPLPFPVIPPGQVN